MGADASSKQIPAAAAPEVCRGLDLSAAATALLEPSLRVNDYLLRLVESGLHADAIRVLARAVPAPAAIWWAVTCVWAVYRLKPTRKVDEAVAAVCAWVQDPSEKNRRAAEAIGKEIGPHHPAGLLATAVFTSGGSIAPAGLPEVAPDPHLSGEILASCILLAATKVKSKHLDQCKQHFISLAVDLFGNPARRQPDAQESQAPIT